jgi:predicted RNase H-like HicB family nuclease
VSSSVVEAVFTQDDDGTWLVTMPALEGCHTFGESLDDARAQARDAVRLWLESEDFELDEVVEASHPG